MADTNNDPELDGRYLGTISEDFALVSDTLKEASYALRKRGFSDFPIFPISKVEIPIGKLLIAKAEMALSWNYYITYLDEFIQRQLVTDADVFKKAYKDPDEFCCLFVVEESFTNFVFIPYPVD